MSLSTAEGLLGRSSSRRAAKGRTELGVGLSISFIEEVYVEHRRVQDSAEEQTRRVVRSLENNACVVVAAIDSFNAFSMYFVDTCCGNLVFTVGVTPICQVALSASMSAGARWDRLGVRTNQVSCRLLLSFEAEASELTALEGAVVMLAPAITPMVSRRRCSSRSWEKRKSDQGSKYQVQGTALFELRGILLVDLERFRLVLGLEDEDTSAQHAGSSDGGCAAEQYAAAHDRVELEREGWGGAHALGLR